jgi:hypothetical protein
MTDQPNLASARRRGRPCKNAPWLREVAEKVARGVPLRRALWSLRIQFTERELKNTYRLKRFREFYETAKIEFYRETGDVARRSHTSLGERYLAARLNASRMESYRRTQ